MLIFTVLSCFVFTSRLILTTSQDSQRFKNSTAKMEEMLGRAINLTADGLAQSAKNETLLNLLKEGARAEQEDKVVSLMIIVLGALFGLMTVIGIAFYWESGYCSSTLN